MTEELAGCGGRLRLLATIAHPPAIAKILGHLRQRASIYRRSASR